MIALACAIGGAAAGVLQAGSLLNTARGRAHPLRAPARLLVVGAVLLAAALASQLAVATAGWLAGFVAAGALIDRGLR